MADNEFGVSFRNAIQGAQWFNVEIAEVGREMDTAESRSRVFTSAFSKHMTTARTQANKLEKDLHDLGVGSERAGKMADSAFASSVESLKTLSNGMVQTAAKAKALHSSTDELARLMRQQAKDKAYIQWQERIAAMHAKTAGESQFLKARLSELDSEVGKSNANLKAQVAAKERAATADVRQATSLRELKDQYERLGTAEAREIEVLKLQIRERRRHIVSLAEEATTYTQGMTAKQRHAEVSRNERMITQQLISAHREMAVTGEKVAWGYERLTQGSANLAASQNRAKEAIDRANREMIEGEQNLDRYTGANNRAAQAAERLAHEERKAATARKAQMAELRADIEWRSRIKADEQTKYAQQANAGDVTESERRRRQELDQLRRAIEGRYRADGKAQKVVEKLTSSEAKYKSRLEQVNNLIILRNKQATAQAQANNHLTGAQARQADQMRKNIALYQKQAMYAKMTTAQLLGLSRGHDRVARGINLNAQAAAIFRAGLGGLSASIGIYTSATVAAAAASYALAAAFRNTLTSGMEFTEMMSRAEAVMMTGTEAFTASGKSMAALEMQVRSLGQSTVFTATEVSAGLVDLGTAGLSASDAMRALKPALDLASIGNVSMSKSADIATNVMTAFKLSADDLGGVVDILATAVSSSNTNIEQLANALSYVAPAAKAAGFGLKDTTAAIELLSNAGIKSSKAGTGLRRFMLNIQNPSNKAAEVLAKYGIGLQDAEGNTRGLIDILGQFNKALHKDGIIPSERMAAVVDLVGVRAASAVSRMISSVDELSVFRRGLDDAAGAAEEMREKIEDNLTADWKQVKSSFQELQLEVFGEFEDRLRLTAAEVTNFFQTLTKEGADGTSSLDSLIGSVAQFTDIAKSAAQAFLVFKGFGIISTLTGAAALQIRNFSLRMGTLFNRLTASSTATNLLSASYSRLKVSLSSALVTHTNYYRALLASTTATQRLAAAASWASASVAGLVRGLSLVASALGWVGLVWGLYTAIKTTFGGSEPYVEAHRNSIKGLQGEYETLTEKIKKTQREKNRLALQTQQRSDAAELAGVNSQIQDTRISLGVVEDPGSRQALEDRLFRLQGKSEELNKSFVNAGESLNALTSHEEVESLIKTQDRWSTTIADTQRGIGALSSELEDLGGAEGLVSRSIEHEIKLWKALQYASSLHFSTLSEDVKQAQADLPPYVKALNDVLEAQRDSLAEERRFDQLSVRDKMVETEQKLAKAKAVVAAMDANPSTKALDVFLRQEEVVKELQEELIAYGYDLEDIAEKGTSSYQQLLDLQSDDKDSIRDIRTELAALNFERMSMIANAVVNGGTIDSEGMNDLWEASVGYQKKLNSLIDERDKPSSGLSEAEKYAKEAEKAFESLRGEFSPLEVALEKHNDQMAMMTSLHQAGKISTDDFTSAQVHLRKKLYEVRLEESKHQQVLDDLNDTYRSSPFGESHEDLTKLNKLLKEGNISLARHADLKDRIEQSQRDEVLSGLPSSDVGEAPSGVMSGFLNTSISRSEGLSDYSDRSDSLDDGFDIDVDDIALQAERKREALEAEQLSQIAHAERMEKIKRQEKEGMLQAERKYDTQSKALQASQAEYAEQSSKMVAISMVGSLENVFAQVASAGEDATKAQKLAFVAQKALAVAQIIMQTHVAAARAPAEAGPILGIPLATAIMAQGYASAGLVGALAVGQLTGAGGDSGGGGESSYSGAYDKGGNIPAGKWGIAGEVGPEIVHGPANVTSRKDTAKQLGGGDNNVSFSPVIQVTVEGGQTEDSQDDREKGKMIGKQVEAQVLKLFQREMRPNGVLERGMRKR